jgi:hypothetical protein
MTGYVQIRRRPTVRGPRDAGLPAEAASAAQAGFSLVELMAMCLVMCTLAAFVLPFTRTTLNAINAVPIRRIYERWVSKFEGAWANVLIDVKERADGN